MYLDIYDACMIFTLNGSPYDIVTMTFLGKLFMCSHADGTITTWNYKQQQKPVSIMAPHARTTKTGKTSPCKPINKIAWKTMKNG